MRFDYTLVEGWSGVTEKRAHALIKELPTCFRPLIVSDNSLTLDLELLYGARVDVVVRFKGFASLDRDHALYLDEQPLTETMEREVWLVASEKRMVYAQCIIPLTSIKKELLDALKKYEDEPLGRILMARKIPLVKDRLQIGIVRSLRVAVELGIDETTPMIARRYRLINRDASGDWIIKAGITEIFNPDILSTGNPL